MSSNFIEAIQFNGWNYGHLYDWIYNCKGTYQADYLEDCVIAGCPIKRNDWVMKIKDNVFDVMTNSEFQNKYL